MIPRSAWRVLMVAGGLTVLVPAVAFPQEPPSPTGTVALEGTMRRFYAAANTVVVATVDGVEHVFHFTKDLLVHGGKGTGVDALSGLREGTPVVVHYSGQDQSAEEIDQIGDEGLKSTEGVVTRIDRRGKRIAVRLEDGKTEEFTLTDRAAADAGTAAGRQSAPGSRIIIYYSDDQGRRVVHYFKPAK
jgi:hypothetical protein